MNSDSVSSTRRFVLNETVSLEEDAVTEFKEVTSQNPVRTIVDTVEDYVVAFLNGEGGSLFWGIRDADRSVVGISLNVRTRDELRKGITGKVQLIQPVVDPTQYQLHFHPVEGEAVDSHLFVVEVAVPPTKHAEPFYNHKGDLHVKLNGVKQKLKGPQLTAFIKTRLRSAAPIPGDIDDPKIKQLVQRVRRVFTEHGVEPSHLARFLEVRKAPFSIELRDYQTDASLLHWLDEAKLDWIARTFLIRREWIDGEDDRIHEHFLFDKQPERFFNTVSQHVEGLVYEEVSALPYAYFTRWGIDKEWKRKGQSRIYVVLAIPLARFSNERIIYKYISDFNPYPWDYPRAYIQLRAWARLLHLELGFACFGKEVSYEFGQTIWSNHAFLHDAMERQLYNTRDDWHPEDYGLSPKESMVAKDTESLPQVIQFLRDHNLPTAERPI